MITYLASWFIIDVLGCPQRGSHGFLGQVPELDFQVLSIGQAPKREETVHAPHHYSKFQEEFCKEGTDPYTPDTAEDRDPETGSRLQVQIFFFPNQDSFCPWTVHSPALPGVTSRRIWPRGCPSSSSNLNIPLTVTSDVTAGSSNSADLLQLIYWMKME